MKDYYFNSTPMSLPCEGCSFDCHCAYLITLLVMCDQDSHGFVQIYCSLHTKKTPGLTVVLSYYNEPITYAWMFHELQRLGWSIVPNWSEIDPITPLQHHNTHPPNLN